ncbi:hypothetical protein BACERE00175_02232 [Bacillus cereus]|uniref:hypothetical protein n=1 Tax=Bacillus cereus TaxID=1396 RepID=UPI000A300F85|nr:hypothetical protein [Bacillus cereus]SMD90875.1 hypothetical protein BACERE00175_02232 [Bacillus cereus]
MGNLKKKNIIILIIVTIIALTIGCTAKSIHARNITKERAAKAAIQHIKTRENIDVIVTKIDTYQLELAGSIRVSGYDKNNKQKKHYVVINKIQNYKVSYWG